MVGGDYLPRDVRALALDGRLVMIAHQGGPKVELNFAQVMVKRLTITGSTLRPQSVEAKARIAADLRREVWPLLDAGRIAPGDRPQLPARGRRRGARLPRELRAHRQDRPRRRLTSGQRR